MSKIKVGVIGAGYWGPNLIRNFVETPLADVVGVADLSQDRLRHIKSRYPEIEVTTDYRELFRLGVEAVVIATPPPSHHKLAHEALSSGLHVLVEKPLTLSSEDALDLTELAERNGLVLMAGHTFVYNPAVRALKELIVSGELGSIYYIDAVRTNLGLFQSKTNAIWDLAPHDISILLYLLDENPTSVTANGGTCIWKDVYDLAYIHLKFPSQTLANMRVSWLDPQKIRQITVVGSKKMVLYDDVAPEKLRIYDKGIDIPPYTDTFGEFQLSYRYGDIVIPPLPTTEPLRLECEHFLDCITNHKTPLTDGRAGLNIVRILEAIDQSLSNQGERVNLNFAESAV